MNSLKTSIIDITKKFKKAHCKPAFSLIEVLVALTLLALSMATVISSFNSNSFQIQFQRDRFHANRIAMHLAGQYYLFNKWPDIGSKRKDIKVGENLWEWEAKVITTSEKKMRRVEINVFSEIDPEQVLARHVLFVTNPTFK